LSHKANNEWVNENMRKAETPNKATQKGRQLCLDFLLVGEGGM